jgi:choline monooxygenase
MTLNDKLAAFDATLPLDRARTIPASWYFDSEIYAAERRAIFGDTWQCIGRAEQVAKPGQFLTADIAGEPVLVVRGEDRVLRAFHNVCRHRGARVAIEPCGTATKLRCRYHGWTYDLAGRLRGVPEFDGVTDFRREDNGLSPMIVDNWGPLLFVSGRPQIELVEALAPLTSRTKNLGLERLRFAQRKEYDLACNWKVYVDNYLDGGYHVNTIHPGLAGAIDYSGYHTVIEGETSVQISPLKPPDASLVGAVRAGDNAYYWWLFPNFMINIYQGVMDTNLVLPLGPERCRVVFDFYFDDGTDPQFIARSIEVADQVQAEDMDICEDVQRGLSSISYDTGRFSVRREAGGYHFHQLLARKLADAGSEQPHLHRPGG